MANRFWVGGTGNWDAADTTHWSATTGGAGGASVPTSADNVTFDSASNATAYTVTCSGTPTCLDLVLGAPASGKVTFTGGSNLDIFGSANFSGGTAGITWTFNSQVHYKATSTGKTITTAGLVINTQHDFDGVGGGWTLQDNLDLSVSRALNLNVAATLNSNAKNVTCSSTNFAAGSTVDLSGSTWTLGSSWTASATTTVTVNTSSVISMAGTAFAGGGKTYNDLTTTSASFASMTGANTFRNLTMSGATSVTVAANQTVTGTLTATGTSATARTFIASDTVGTARTFTAAVVSLTDTDFQDITGAGAASPFTGTRLGDCKGNSGITFTTAANKFWVGNTAAWGAVNVWALTTGGAGATNNYPLPQDAAIFDANSFSANGQAVSCVSGQRIPTVDFSAITFTGIVFNTSFITLFGNLTLKSTMTVGSTSAQTTFAGRTTQVVDTAGVTFDAPIIINSPGGTVQLGAALTVGSTRLTTLTAGTLNLNGLTFSTGTFNSTNSNVRSITSGGGSISVTGNNATIVNMNTATNFTRADVLTFNLTYSGATGTRTIAFGAGGSASESNVPNIKVSAGTDIFTASAGYFYRDMDFTGFAGTNSATDNTFYGSLTFSTGMTMAAGSALAITMAATSGTKTITSNGKTIDQPVIFAGAGGTFQLADNMTVGSTRTVTLTSGTLNLNGKTLSTGLINSSGSTTRSITSGIGGITLTGNAGTILNFGTTTNFSLGDALTFTSNYSGSTGTRTLTTNSAITEAQSFSLNVTAGTDTIQLSGTAGVWKNVNYTGFAGTDSSWNTTVYGNFTLASGMTLTTAGNTLTLAATSGTQTITSSGKTIDQAITQNGVGGTVSLADALTLGATRTYTLTAGTLDLNAGNLSTGIFSSSGSTARAITFASGRKLITTNTTATTVFTAATTTNLTVTRSGGTLEIGGNTTNVRTVNLGASKTWPTITFTNTTAAGGLDLVSSGTATIIKSLAYTGGTAQTIRRTAATTIRIEDDSGFPSGTAGNLITIGSITAASHTWDKAIGGLISSDYLSISRSTATLT